MSALRGFIAGTLAVAAVQRVLSTQAAAGRVGELATGTGRGIERFLSPDVPALGPATDAWKPPPASGGPDMPPGWTPPNDGHAFPPVSYPTSTRPRHPKKHRTATTKNA